MTSMRSRDELRAALRQQIEIVAVQGGSDRGDTVALRRAECATIELVEELGLRDFLGALTFDRKPRFLLVFATPQMGPLAGASTTNLVLKVYPDQPRGEGPALIAWHTRGLPVPETRCGQKDGCSWLVLDYLDLTPIHLRSLEDALELTAEVASYARAMHTPVPVLSPFLRPLDAVMAPRWERAAQVLTQHGYRIRSGWREVACRAYRGGSAALLHGDIGLTNVGRDPWGRLVVYDPSALWGDAAFDAARWAARLTTEDVLPELVLERWLRVEGLENAEVARLLLGAECLLEAGSRLMVWRGEAGLTDSGGGGDAVPLLLKHAARLLR